MKKLLRQRVNQSISLIIFCFLTVNYSYSQKDSNELEFNPCIEEFTIDYSDDKYILLKEELRKVLYFIEFDIAFEKFNDIKSTDFSNQVFHYSIYLSESNKVDSLKMKNNINIPHSKFDQLLFERLKLIDTSLFEFKFSNWYLRNENSFNLIIVFDSSGFKIFHDVW